MPDERRPDRPSGDPPGTAADRPAAPAPDPPASQPAAPQPAARGRRERKAMLLRLDPEVHDALARWAADELRSTNAHVEFLLRRAVVQAGRLGERPASRRRAGPPS